jgi:predicted peroxiredoxin
VAYVEGGSNQLFTTCERTKAEVTVQYLKEVLDACQNAGMKFVATACGMGVNNIKAFKLETTLQIS